MVLLIINVFWVWRFVWCSTHTRTRERTNRQIGQTIHFFVCDMCIIKKSTKQRVWHTHQVGLIFSENVQKCINLKWWFLLMLVLDLVNSWHLVSCFISIYHPYACIHMCALLHLYTYIIVHSKQLLRKKRISNWITVHSDQIL